LGQSGPLRTGYVIVTPQFGDFNDFSVFQTVGFGSSGPIGQATISQPPLATRGAFIIPAESLPGRQLGIALVNPTNSDSIVTLTARRSDGSFVASANVTLGARQQRAEFLSGFFSNRSELDSGFRGAVSVVSSTAIGVLGLRFRGDAFSLLPFVDLSPLPSGVPTRPGGGGGPAAVLLPQFASGAGWATQITIANTSISALVVRVDVFDAEGEPLAVTLNGQTRSGIPSLTVPPQGIVVLSSADDGPF
jgi:hypothetical protein